MYTTIQVNLITGLVKIGAHMIGHGCFNCAMVFGPDCDYSPSCWEDKIPGSVFSFFMLSIGQHKNLRGPVFAVLCRIAFTKKEFLSSMKDIN